MRGDFRKLLLCAAAIVGSSGIAAEAQAQTQTKFYMRQRIVGMPATTAGDASSSAPAPSYTYTPTYASTYSTCVAVSAGSTSGTQAMPLSGCARSDGTDVTAANQAAGYTYCAAMSGSKSCTIAYTPTYSTTYGSCTGGRQTAPIATCTQSSDGASVSTSYCSPQTTSKSCVCDTLTPGTFDTASSGLSLIGTSSSVAAAQSLCASARNSMGAGVCSLNTYSGGNTYYHVTSSGTTGPSGSATAATPNYGAVCR